MSKLIKGGNIHLSGTILKDEYIWPEDVGYFSAPMLQDALAEMSGDVVVFVNSDGGMASEGEALRAALEAYPGKVTVMIAGSAHSAASLMVMAADHIEMSAGSLMLIHDPSAGVGGNPADLRAAADTLDVMADAYAAVYAARAGITADEARAIMQADTMLSAPAAVEAGFADAVTAAPNADEATMSRTQAITAAHAAMHRAQEAQMKFEAAQADLETGESQNPGQEAIEIEEVPTMTDENTPAPGAPVVAPVAPVLAPVMQTAPDAIMAAERARVKGIREASAPFMAHISQAKVDAMIDDGTTLADANAVIMAAAAAGQPAIARSDDRLDERTTKRAGMADAVVAQMLGTAPKDERAQPYMDMSFVDMAADLTGSARPRTVGAKAEVLMLAAHGVSDFPLILGNAFNTVIEGAYDLVDPTFGAISREMNFSDFRAHDVVRPDNFPTLQKIGENGEIKFGTFGEGKETVALASYATGITVTRQLMINDTMGAVAQVLRDAANIVPEFEEETFWAMLLGNPKLRDGKAVFHADHNNLGASGAVNATNVAAGRLAMRSHKQKDERAVKSNAPAFLVCGPARETEAEAFLTPINAVDQANVNVLQRSLTLQVTEEITDDKWFLMVAPERKTSCFRHGYLEGMRAPRIRVEDPFGSQGTSLTIEHDFGVGAVGYMGAYRRG